MWRCVGGGGGVDRESGGQYFTCGNRSDHSAHLSSLRRSGSDKLRTDAFPAEPTGRGGRGLGICGGVGVGGWYW